MHTIRTLLLLTTCIHFLCAQTIFERLTHSGNNVNKTSSSTIVEDDVKIVQGAKVKRSEHLKLPFGSALGGKVLAHPLWNYGTSGYVFPNWLAAAQLKGAGESEVTGLVTFQALPYNNEVKITLNATGLPAGRHALHIHTYGDISEGCAGTGAQFPNNFLGNVEAKEDGSISLAFLSIYINLFGFNGIVGRSFVIHANPIDLSTALNADIFSTSLKGVPYSLVYQNEESALGAILACGVISIMNANIANPAATPPK